MFKHVVLEQCRPAYAILNTRTAGRLMPYARAPSGGLLPFMDWHAKDASEKAMLLK